MAIVCDTLVRTRRDKERGCSVRLKNPEPCGKNAQIYEIRADKRLLKRGNDNGKQTKLMGVDSWQINVGCISVRQALCDKHKAKAKREGLLLTPVLE